MKLLKMKELTEGMKHYCYQLNLTSKSQHDCENLNASEQMLESMEKNLLRTFLHPNDTESYNPQKSAEPPEPS